jgi:hypothetical protein
MRDVACSTAAWACVALAVHSIFANTAAEAGIVVSFQEGVDGYTGTQDTWISELEGDHGADATLFWDGPTGTGSINPLLRFDNIIGNAAGQIAPGSAILSATLTLEITGNFGEVANLHRMLVTWSETDTYATLVDGVSLDDVEAVAALDATTSSGQVSPITVDVTASVQQWASGAANFGWLIDQPTTDGVTVHSSEAVTPSLRPLLVVEFQQQVPEPSTLTLAGLGAIGLIGLGRRRGKKAPEHGPITESSI